ncbi:hypothetical protein PGT21_011325 [Puccinia graminis f. sp. tritici]|uniref:Uncharacterized protein n=1 Tax=Puccinia graminis f. sp. tritici TaxID=56615 RepID=A0A5B0SL03_PUCGR|nr:hypothetical protein PGT21_011325 [Puccinia graminis f. sp. tritici]KAA1138651.1 hypothetical protein PGTUg99_033103 [Puccinia graminis f. sp. tritici]
MVAKYVDGPLGSGLSADSRGLNLADSDEFESPAGAPAVSEDVSDPIDLHCSADPACLCGRALAFKLSCDRKFEAFQSNIPVQISITIYS